MITDQQDRDPDRYARPNNGGFRSAEAAQANNAMVDAIRECLGLDPLIRQRPREKISHADRELARFYPGASIWRDPLGGGWTSKEVP